MATVIFLGLWFGVIAWVAVVAHHKYRSPVGWGLLAMFVGVLAFIPLLIVGESDEGRRERIREDEEIRAEVQAERYRQIRAEEETRARIRSEIEQP